MDREACCAVAHESQAWMSDWTELIYLIIASLVFESSCVHSCFLNWLRVNRQEVSQNRQTKVNRAIYPIIDLEPNIRHAMEKNSGSVQSLSRVQLFVTPWTTARQASLSITNSWSPPKPCPLSRWCHPTRSKSPKRCFIYSIIFKA